MKAREIKKALLDDYDKAKTYYITSQAEHVIELRMLKSQIKGIENMLDNYFGISENYFDELLDPKPEPLSVQEVNDVPF